MADPGAFDFNTASRPALVDQEDWDRRLTALRASLKQRANDFVQQIFPNAHIAQGEARIGNLDGDPGASLSISLNGDKAGLWTDHATGEGGDIIDLWTATRRTTFVIAVADLEQWAGLTKSKQPAWASTVARIAAERQKHKQPAEDRSLGAPTATWLYRSEEGKILVKVSRYELPNGDKEYRPFDATAGRHGAPEVRPLYRLPDIKAEPVIVLVEGEKCADWLWGKGIPATTAMQGSGAPVDKTDWTPLKGKTVILWPDNDTPGFKLMKAIEPALRRMGCLIGHVSPPPDAPEKWDAADTETPADHLPKELPERIPAQRFQILTIDELFDIKPPEWRIDSIFPTHGTSAVYGAFESFKSFVAIDMALALATGQAWQGRATKPTNVLYVAGEGQHGLAHRVYGWCAIRNGGQRPMGFRALPEALAIPLLGDTDALLRSIDSTGLEFGLIVFDTVTRMSGGGSLNDEKDVQAYVRGSDRIRLVTGGHVMHLGHAGKDKEKGLMGSVVLAGAMETIIAIERRADSLTLINSNPQGKQKDGPNFEDIRLQARIVHFERGDEDATTRILVEDNDIVNENRERKLGPRQQKILDLIATAATRGQVLGFNRLLIMSGLDNGSLGKVLRDLNDKGLISEVQDGDVSGWKLL